MLAQHTHRRDEARFRCPDLYHPRGGKEGLGGQILPCPPQEKFLGPEGVRAHSLYPRLSHLSHPGPGPAQASAAVPDPGGVIQRRAATPRRLWGTLPQVSPSKAAALGVEPSTSQSGWAWGLLVDPSSLGGSRRNPAPILTLYPPPASVTQYEACPGSSAHLGAGSGAWSQVCPLSSSPHGWEGLDADPAIRVPGAAGACRHLVLRSKSPRAASYLHYPPPASPPLHGMGRALGAVRWASLL